MYPKNAASPERIAVGSVVLIADGTPQTSGVSIDVIGQGGASGSGGGSTAYENGVVLYTPTQAETNYTSFVVTAFKASCLPAAITVVTGAGSVPGVTTANLTQVNGAAQTATLDTIKAETVLIVADTNELQADDVPTLIAALPTAEENADQVWDEILTGTTHNIATSAGRRLRGIQEFQGYEAGAIWIDTVNGTAGTTDYENGTVENPVDSIADANTLAASLGMSRFVVLSGSSLTLAASQENQSFLGHNWTLDLGGQSISGSFFSGATVSGIGTGSSRVLFENGSIGTATLPGNHKLKGVGLSDAITINSAGDLVWHGTISEVPNNGTPVLDSGVAVANLNINIRGHIGGLEVKNLGQAGTDAMSYDCPTGQLILNANCVGGAIRRAGLHRLTNNGSGMTITQGFGMTIISDANEEVTAENAAVGAGLTSLATGTAQAGTITTITLAAGATATDDLFSQTTRILLTGGTGAGQSRLITDYDGTTKIATIVPQWITDPSSDTTYEIQAADAGGEGVWRHELGGLLEVTDSAAQYGSWIYGLVRGLAGARILGNTVGGKLSNTSKARFPNFTSDGSIIVDNYHLTVGSTTDPTPTKDETLFTLTDGTLTSFTPAGDSWADYIVVTIAGGTGGQVEGDLTINVVTGDGSSYDLVYTLPAVAVGETEVWALLADKTLRHHEFFNTSYPGGTQVPAVASEASANSPPTDITYNADGTENVITRLDGSIWTHNYADGRLTSITVT